MQIRSLNFVEGAGTPEEWSIDGLLFGSRNLIVGRNATGKTRALNVTYALARYLSGLQGPISTSSYDCVFAEENHTTYRYQLEILEDKVVNECLMINDEVKLQRGPSGEGAIFAEKINGGQNIQFQAPTTGFAAVMRSLFEYIIHATGINAIGGRDIVLELAVPVAKPDVHRILMRKAIGF